MKVNLSPYVISYAGESIINWLVFVGLVHSYMLHYNFCLPNKLV